MSHTIKIIVTIILGLAALINFAHIFTFKTKSNITKSYWGLVIDLVILYFMWRKQLGI